jgi:hypothetical protein
MTRYIAILVATLVPGVVSAQDAAQSWPGKAKAGATVYVVDDTGAETSGRLLRLDPDSLVLLVGDTERRFDAARVTRIEKRGDSKRNGAIIGAVVGAAIGAFSMGMADCPGDGGGSCPGFRAAGVVISTGVYAAIGAGIDALVVGRTTWYEAPAASRRSARLAPRGRAAVSMTLRW